MRKAVEDFDYLNRLSHMPRWTPKTVGEEVLAIVRDRSGDPSVHHGSSLSLSRDVADEVALALEETFDVELEPRDVAEARQMRDWVRMVALPLLARGRIHVRTQELTGAEEIWPVVPVMGEDAPASERVSLV